MRVSREASVRARPGGLAAATGIAVGGPGSGARRMVEAAAHLVDHVDAKYDSIASHYNDSGLPVQSVDLFGHSDRGELTRVETLKSAIFWFIWYDFHKSTDVNRV